MYNFIRKHRAKVAAGLAGSVFLALPAAALRELHTDRPDQTESPYTVDAGHWQVEADVVNATFDRDGGARTTAWSVAPTNLKFGLNDRTDFQLMVEPWIHTRAEDRATGVTERAAGFGDVTTRLKVNFWGNDGGRTAFGVMPFVKWPLPASGLRNGKTEGGVIFPLSVELPAGWGMGAMTELDFVSNGAGGHDTEWVNSITFGRDLTDKWGGYVEVVVVTGNAPGFAWQGQFDVGFTYAVANDLQLDFGCNFGLTHSAPDYQPFAGVSRRV
jgi:hypothetical protein